jgi:transcription elongation factor Elf1
MMPLNKAQQRRVEEWLKANFECPRCGRTHLWTADLAALPLDGSDRTLPILVVSCQTCGRVQLFSAWFISIP